jgi:hypothetical protein
MKILDTGEKIGIGTTSTPYSIQVDKNTFIGFGGGNPYEKLNVSGKIITIGPHGKNCGCEWFDKEGNKNTYTGLGCQNPNNKLEVNGKS